eukprot:3177489-Alexandrium_andersonii.AAC.1
MRISSTSRTSSRSSRVHVHARAVKGSGISFAESSGGSRGESLESPGELLRRESKQALQKASVDGVMARAS